MTTGSKNSSTKNDSHFNAIIDCYGYINEVKVTTDKVRVSVARLHGAAKKPKHKYYSLSVPTDQAKDLVLTHADEINNKDIPVFATLVISDGDSSPFVFDSGEKKGELGVTHFGALLEIKRLKVDGVVTHSKHKDGQPDSSLSVGSQPESNEAEDNHGDAIEGELVEDERRTASS